MSVTRAEILSRAARLWPTGTVPYAQDRIHGPTGYRQDCSGFVSMCWAIPVDSHGSFGGMNTVSLVTAGWMREIPAADLLPGDAVGICGPGTGGDDGHIVLFERWLNDIDTDDRYFGYEQAGGSDGPLHRVIRWPYDGSGGPWKAYRFRDISEGFGPAPSPGGTTMSDYTPLGRPAAVGDRGDSVLLADLWFQELRDDSPFIAGNPSPRVLRERRIEAKCDQALAELKAARAEIAALRTGGIDIAALAAAIAPRLPAVPSLAEIAKAVADEHARRARD
ncbi:hypothetical protein [Longispora urticae]